MGRGLGLTTTKDSSDNLTRTDCPGRCCDVENWHLVNVQYSILSGGAAKNALRREAYRLAPASTDEKAGGARDSWPRRESARAATGGRG